MAGFYSLLLDFISIDTDTLRSLCLPRPVNVPKKKAAYARGKALIGLLFCMMDEVTLLVTLLFQFEVHFCDLFFISSV